MTPMNTSAPLIATNPEGRHAVPPAMAAATTQHTQLTRNLSLKNLKSDRILVSVRQARLTNGNKYAITLQVFYAHVPRELGVLGRGGSHRRWNRFAALRVRSNQRRACIHRCHRASAGRSRFYGSG